jgi:hypothetical protein
MGIVYLYGLKSHYFTVIIIETLVQTVVKKKCGASRIFNKNYKLYHYCFDNSLGKCGYQNVRV